MGEVSIVWHIWVYVCEILPIDFKGIVGDKSNTEEEQSYGTRQKLKGNLMKNNYTIQVCLMSQSWDDVAIVRIIIY